MEPDNGLTADVDRPTPTPTWSAPRLRRIAGRGEIGEGVGLASDGFDPTGGFGS
jgi:hypothetical protein